MKARTFHQPWASLVALGHKTVETRSQHPGQNMVGQRIAIHAGLTLADYRETWRSQPWLWPFLDGLGELPRGAVVAVATLTEVHQAEEVYESQQEGLLVACRSSTGLRSDGMTERLILPSDPWGDYSPGRFLWVLEDVQPLVVPVPAVGHQGWWEWDHNDQAEGALDY